MAIAKKKAKAKSKSKATPKKRPVAKKAKAKAKAKTQGKAKAKATATAKTTAKTKAKAKTTAKTKAKKFEIDLSTQQKTGLLATIAKLVELHKSDKDGLKSLTRIDRILDKYNQHYTKPADKFDAIVKYGMEEDSVAMSKNYYVLPKDNETATLYQLLDDIGRGKRKFPEVKDKIHQLYTDALKSRR